MGVPKKKPVSTPGFRGPQGSVNGFSMKGVKKPVRATYYGKKAR